MTWVILCKVIVPALFVSHGAAQSFNNAPPTFWRKPTITASYSTRTDSAKKAFQPIFDNLVNQTADSLEFKDNPPEFSMPGTFIYELALFDFLTNQTQYRDTVQSYFESVANDNPYFEGAYLDTPLIYGYAAMQAYHAYGDPLYLQYAQDSWEFGSDWTITTDDVTNGRFPGANWTLPPHCTVGSLAGGTFYENVNNSFFEGQSNSTYINALATGSFFVLSALLAEATSNQTYMNAAELTLTFVENELLTGSDAVKDGINGNDCGNGGFNYPYDAGIMIEGLAVMNSLQALQDINTH
ncbi:hypothetical protein GYMLUDRAFT_563255 [Collybiopsis luxurians FD-317 M1]|uniref:Cellulase n=1 Tax=Collybiopsis luxurians FD-317 M1 TaxID=944289 RepID=A0A0D0CS58_9AGAR|nr:hypothetical protein GYMLUDRAFT_563255 [Collybiopsis luxurians FD-317 M1]